MQPDTYDSTGDGARYLHPSLNESSIRHVIHRIRSTHPLSFQLRSTYDIAVPGFQEMDDSNKTKDQLVRDIAELRGRVQRLNDLDQRRRALFQEDREENKLFIKRFRSLAKVAPIGIHVSDADGKCWFVNQEWCNISGTTATDVNEFGWEKTLHPDHRIVLAEWRGAIEHGRQFRSQFRFRHPAGTDVWVWAKGVPERTQDARVTGYITTIADVTRLKEAEDKERYLAAIVNSSEDEIIGQTLEGIIVSWNSGAERMYGYSESEVIGKSISILESPDRKGEIFECLDQIKTGKKIKHFETVRVLKNGTRVDVSLNLSPIYGDRGKVIGVSAVARDITERKDAEEKIRYLAAIVNSTDDAIIGKSLDGRIVSWNLGAERMYGYSEREILGKSVTLLEAPDRKNEIFDCLNQIGNGLKIENFETLRICKDGTRLSVSLTISPIEDEDHVIIGASAIDRVVIDSTTVAPPPTGSPS